MTIPKIKKLFFIRNMHRIKLYFDQADFTFCAKAHIWPPDTGSGCYDAVCFSFFQNTIRIFPHQRKEKIAGKELTVMRMSAKDQISAGVGEQGEFFWLVIGLE